MIYLFLLRTNEKVVEIFLETPRYDFQSSITAWHAMRAIEIQQKNLANSPKRCVIAVEMNEFQRELRLRPAAAHRISRGIEGKASRCQPASNHIQHVLITSNTNQRKLLLNHL